LSRKGAAEADPAAIAARLLEYCRSHDWAGADPYDGLTSRVFQALWFLDTRWARLALIQSVKRSPINFRRLLGIPRGQNPKGIALFLTSAVKLSKAGLLRDDEPIRSLSARLAALASLKEGHWGWGYNFDWQTRTVLVERGTPNIICTTFAANALLDAWQHDPDQQYLDMAASAVGFLLERLYREEGGAEACFSYTPHARTSVHNANLLGAALLCRVARVTGDAALLPPALKAARFSANRQQEDGAWDYGEQDQPSQRWIDNFHTGFNLCALHRIGLDAGTSEFEPHIRRGFEYYRSHFFAADGAPKYYHDRLYPIDIHSAAQSMITLLTLEELDKTNRQQAENVLAWTMANMWSESGYFYYQKHRCWTIRIPYMRWSQAWMLLALSTMLEHSVPRAALTLRTLPKPGI
jgi:hypothetical protein